MSFSDEKNQIRVPAQSNSRATHHIDERAVVSKSKGATYDELVTRKRIN